MTSYFWDFSFKSCKRQERARSRQSDGRKYSSWSLLAVISLIWPAGEHVFKSESCLSTLATGVDHSTGTLSINIHQFHNMPAPNIPSLSHKCIKIQKHTQPCGVARHVHDSYFTFLYTSHYYLFISSRSTRRDWLLHSALCIGRSFC